MKTTPATLGLIGLATSLATAGTVLTESAPTSDGFAKARRPITNPTLFDLALPTTNIHPLFLSHRLPNTVSPGVPLGGDVQLYALQFEIAFNERLSLVATKDGYVDFNAIGFRSRLTEAATIGVAYEIPLTDDRDSLMKDRITVDLIWTF